jgi:signal transduction histidine kinase
MKDARVVPLLAVTIFVMAALPLLAALYLVQDALRTSLDLGFNPQVVRTLDHASANLRTLGRLEPEQRAAYRAQFDEVEELKQVYSDPELVKRSILESLRLYFGLGLGAALLLSIGVASLLSRRIARLHAHNLTALSRERDQVRYLQEMASWQELAKMLAHEIKNPLTPIEVLVTSLSKAYLGKSQPEFLAHLEQTNLMIGEEITHLKATVNKFSEFARLPRVQLAPADLVDVVRRQLAALPELADRANFELLTAEESIPAMLDITLFRQVLTNLIRNGLEANPDRRVRFDIAIERNVDSILLRIGNDGAPVATDIAPRMFDPYISSKSGKDNMGLGLAIVKKIVLEHGGDIRYEPRGQHPEFLISLPVVA